MTFRVGMKVVCIYDRGQTVAPFARKGDVYTIASIHERWIGMCFELVELPTPSSVPEWACWPAIHFRPIVETDISIFTAMLKTSKERA